MSLVRRLRRMVRADRPDAQRPYQCLSCGQRFELQRQTCPQCGCYRIERTAWSDPME
ncbi:hypothetical protein [Halostella litorea]|uniref:hypothetical protein n=1 Tax=Halostella litorea TaxID=2528831 RepID=UPI00192A4773|nr:hypothetical protein [Halostella litorea]